MHVCKDKIGQNYITLIRNWHQHVCMCLTKLGQIIVNIYPVAEGDPLMIPLLTWLATAVFVFVMFLLFKIKTLSSYIN